MFVKLMILHHTQDLHYDMVFRDKINTEFNQTPLKTIQIIKPN